MSQPLERSCPTCGAEPGQRCVGKRGHERISFHRGRGSRRRAHPIYADPGLPTESPIEKRLAGAILGWLDHNDIKGVGVGTQMPVGPYRADIVVETHDRILVVECDGQAFHCSEEQIARDKRRDRYFAARGISVMRFTGSEIHRDPRGCAAEVGLWVRL